MNWRRYLEALLLSGERLGIRVVRLIHRVSKREDYTNRSNCRVNHQREFWTVRSVSGQFDRLRGGGVSPTVVLQSGRL
jgi:predicted glycosyltransferase involved in capsule biosynthesis